jgi:hypothetical protein
VTVRGVVLATSGAVVLGVSLYLFVKVRASPARPSQDVIDEAKAHVPARRAAPPPTDPWSSGALASPHARAEAARAHLPPPGVRRIHDEPDRAPQPLIHTTRVAPQLSVDEDLARGNGLTEANKSFDHGDYEDAQKQALEMLKQDPGNVKMLRIVVSTSCFMGDPDKAQQYWSQLPETRDRAQMSVRCARYGVTFKP